MLARCLRSQPGFPPRRATAAIELALTMPFVALLVVGSLQIGRMVQINQIINNAAREGARKASTGINTYSDVQTIVANYLTNAGVTNQNGLSVTVYDVTQGNSGPQFNPSTANPFDQLQITVTLPYSNVQLSSTSILPGSSNLVLTGTAVWYTNVNQSYPANITPPLGS
jgi:Flp pilus assembly protein TadG